MNKDLICIFCTEQAEVLSFVNRKHSIQEGCSLSSKKSFQMRLKIWIEGILLCECNLMTCEHSCKDELFEECFKRIQHVEKHEAFRWTGNSFNIENPKRNQNENFKKIIKILCANKDCQRGKKYELNRNMTSGLQRVNRFRLTNFILPLFRICELLSQSFFHFIVMTLCHEVIIFQFFCSSLRQLLGLLQIFSMKWMIKEILQMVFNFLSVRQACHIQGVFYGGNFFSGKFYFEETLLWDWKKYSSHQKYNLYNLWWMRSSKKDSL